MAKARCRYCRSKATVQTPDLELSKEMLAALGRSRSKNVIGWKTIIEELSSMIKSIAVCGGCSSEHRLAVRRLLNERFYKCKLKSDQIKQLQRAEKLLVKARKSMKTLDQKVWLSLREEFEQEASSLQ